MKKGIWKKVQGTVRIVNEPTMLVVFLLNKLLGKEVVEGGSLGFKEVIWVGGEHKWRPCFWKFLSLSEKTYTFFVFTFSSKLGLEIDRPWPNSFIKNEHAKQSIFRNLGLESCRSASPRATGSSPGADGTVKPGFCPVLLTSLMKFLTFWSKGWGFIL